MIGGTEARLDYEMDKTECGSSCDGCPLAETCPFWGPPDSYFENDRDPCSECDEEYGDWMCHTCPYYDGDRDGELPF